MDLIRAYRSFDTQLEDLERLRTKGHRDFAGSFYFGEYLLQGALKIENKCQIVSARAIIESGLSCLQPEFDISKRPTWANEVIRLRETFYRRVAEPQEATDEEVKAAINIAQLFGPHYRLPVAVNFIALLPRQSDDPAILQAFRAAPFTGSSLLPISYPRLIRTDDERENCSPSKTKVIAYDALPEVRQFGNIMRRIYRDFSLRKLKGQLMIIVSFWGACNNETYRPYWRS
jgi:hypothetical protein